MLRKMTLAAALVSSLMGVAYAQQTTTGSSQSPVVALNSLPQNASTVTNWYKQDVYDPSNSKIGQITDVLVNQEGKIDAFIVSVGGFLGVGEKDVAVPFHAIRAAKDNNGKVRLTMNATKDALKNAPGYKYDSSKATWVPA